MKIDWTKVKEGFTTMDVLKEENKEQKKEIKRLNKELEEYKKDFEEVNDLAFKLITNNKECVYKSIKDIVNVLTLKIERLNNIINELEKYLQKEIHNGRSEDNVWLMGCYDEDREILDKLQELKGSDNNG